MFEESETAARSLVGRVCASARAENRAAAEMLVSIDNLYRLRLREDGGHDDWAIDTIVIRDTTLASLAADGTVSRYTENGWLPTTLTPQALAGDRWRQISASQAVAAQRAITFGRKR